MPVVSKAQARFMGAVAGGRVKGVKPSVGKEFLHATPSVKSLLVRKNNGKTNGSRKA